MGALSDPFVSQILGQKFIATYEQVGDFTALRVRDEVVKQGGNVVSYFCTPDLRVIHMVKGPVEANELLAAAKWAVRTHDLIKQSPKASLDDQMRIVQEAHLSELSVSTSDFRQATMMALPSANLRYGSQYANAARYGCQCENGTTPKSPQVLARRMAMSQFGNHHDDVHSILAIEPMVSLPTVYEEYFKRLVNEDVSHRRPRVKLAFAGLQKARRQGWPVLMVLYDGSDKNEDVFNEETQRFVRDVLGQRVMRNALKATVVIALPVKELPALTTLADLPSYEVEQDSSTLIILTDSSGQQLENIPQNMEAFALAQRLRLAVNQERFERAEAYLARGETSDARKLLSKIRGAPGSRAQKQQAEEKLAEIKLKLKQGAQQEAKTAVARKPKVQPQPRRADEAAPEADAVLASVRAP